MSEATWEKRKGVWFAEIKKLTAERDEAITQGFRVNREAMEMEAENERLRAEVQTLNRALEAHTLKGNDPRFIELKTLRHEVQRLRDALEKIVNLPGDFSAASKKVAKAALQATESEGP